jgi:hypothetical protein
MLSVSLTPFRGEITEKNGQKAVLRIRDVFPGSPIFPSRIKKIPDPHQKEFKYFNPTTNFKALGTMIRVVLPGSGSDPDTDFLPIPDPGVKKVPDTGTGSATLAKSHLCEKPPFHEFF